jgi:hypothetical protein
VRRRIVVRNQESAEVAAPIRVADIRTAGLDTASHGLESGQVMGRTRDGGESAKASWKLDDTVPYPQGMMHRRMRAKGCANTRVQDDLLGSLDGAVIMTDESCVIRQHIGTVPSLPYPWGYPPCGYPPPPSMKPVYPPS